MVHDRWQDISPVVGMVYPDVFVSSWLHQMLLVSFGSPSAISYAVTNVVRQTMSACVGPHATFHVVGLDEFKAQWHAAPREGRTAVLVVSDCPQLDVVDLFSSTNGPILVSYDSFDQIVRYVMRARGMALPFAIRFATQVVCSLGVLSRAPNVLRITPEHYDQDMTAFTASLVAFTGIECSNGQFKAVMDALAAGSPDGKETLRQYVERNFPHAGDPADTLDISAEDHVALQVIIDQYGPFIDTGVLLEVVWPTRLFLDWERPGQFLDRTIDLLGPARFIICGPYLHLPIGRWRMFVDFETTQCLSDNELGADVYSGRILSAVTLALPPAGRYGFHLDFEVTNPLLPIELRVQILTGAIEGTFHLIGVRLSSTSTH